MGYRLEAKAPPGVELCAVAIEQIDNACLILHDPGLPVARRVHGARKRIKMLRAIMRLLRGPLGDRFADVNRLLRDAGRALSASRDAEVVRNTFAEVVAAGVPGVAAELVETLTAILDGRADGRRADGTQADVAASGDVEVALRGLSASIAGWDLAEFDRAALIDACTATYRKGRHELKRARKRATPARLHQWRKRAKEHWYHLRLLGDPRREAFDELGDVLGRANDFAVLRQVVRAEMEQIGAEETRLALDTEIERRRAELAAEALRRGDDLYAASPSNFAAGLEWL